MQKYPEIILFVLACLGCYAFHMVNGHVMSKSHMSPNAIYIRKYNQMKDMVHNEVLPLLKVVECPKLLRREVALIDQKMLYGNWFMTALTPPFGENRHQDKDKCVRKILPRIVARSATEEHVISSDNTNFMVIYRCDKDDDSFLMVFRIYTRNKSAKAGNLKKALEVLRVNNISESVVIRVRPERAVCTSFSVK
ncbi:uncharacterized protein LOC111070353 [Drosophila obscura]|uniref:uncharacterized protein LOC111070353 n=1 Tax=Drosophila obscura TaxID=7282 RepID=UPI000BA161F0|nr:uncharacterized protein LOC111070353 [Drosophila obscura]